MICWQWTTEKQPDLYMMFKRLIKASECRENEQTYHRLPTCGILGCNPDRGDMCFCQEALIISVTSFKSGGLADLT
jgi:hypothetical protein